MSITSIRVKIGLFIGRFQPFHRGHLSAVRQVLKKVDFLMIGIGSAQYSHVPDNPFSAGERARMIKKTLRDEKILPKRFKIVLIPDIHDDARWPAHVRSRVPDFDILFTGSGHTRELFEKYDDVKILSPKFEIRISATKIRKKMKKGENWKTYIPAGAFEVIRKIKGAERIMSL